jgi:hypothetical protein
MNITRHDTPRFLQELDLPGSSEGREWRRSLFVTLAAFVGSRAVIWAIAAYSYALMHQPVHLLGMFLQWDSNIYLSIAQHGYVPPVAITGYESGKSNINFFPLLPIGVSLLGWVVHPLLLAGTLFANACLALSGLLLHRLTWLRIGRAAADWSVFCLMFVTGSFVFSSIMSEGPFLLFSVLSAYLHERRWLASSAASSALLSVTRLTGSAQALGFALDWLISRLRGGPASYVALLLIGLIPLPFFIYLAWMFHLTGDAFAAVHSNFGFWHQRLGFPFQNFFMIAWSADPRLQIESVVGLALLLPMLGQVRLFTPGEWLFLLINIVLFSSGVSQTSLIRYMIALYPVHMAMGRLCARHLGGRILLLMLALANSALTICWVHGLDTFF